MKMQKKKRKCAEKSVCTHGRIRMDENTNNVQKRRNKHKAGRGIRSAVQDGSRGTDIDQTTNETPTNANDNAGSNANCSKYVLDSPPYKPYARRRRRRRRLTLVESMHKLKTAAAFVSNNDHARVRLLAIAMSHSEVCIFFASRITSTQVFYNFYLMTYTILQKRTQTQKNCLCEFILSNLKSMYWSWVQQHVL